MQDLYHHPYIAHPMLRSTARRREAPRRTLSSDPRWGLDPDATLIYGAFGLRLQPTLRKILHSTSIYIYIYMYIHTEININK